MSGRDITKLASMAGRKSGRLVRIGSGGDEVMLCILYKLEGTLGRRI